MIKIDLRKDSIVVSGHSGYDEIGKDIVCASVSSMVITTVNAIIRLDDNAIDYTDENGVTINVLKHSLVVDELLDNLINLLEQLEKQYPKNIKIRRC